MRIGVPTEIKNNEFRVGLTPAGVRELVARGHEALIQQGAGAGVDMTDDAYRAAGASIAPDAASVFASSDMIVKVKEPLAPECRMLRSGQILFTYLHLAPAPELTRSLVDSGAVCIAYETVTSPAGGLPLLAPMSEVAGRMSVQAGAHYLEKAQGGRGLLLGGVPGVEPAKVVVIGGGVVGSHAAQVAIGMGADVTVLDRDMGVLKALWRQFGRSVKTVFSTSEAVDAHCRSADLVIGSVLIPGAAAPKLVTADIIAGMRAGAVVVDVAIDQGGCFATSRPTTHDDPVYDVDGVVHYCVANMPGAVPRTSTFALTNATLPYVAALADKGWQRAFREDRHLAAGLNVVDHRIVFAEVADAVGMPFVDPALVFDQAA